MADPDRYPIPAGEHVAEHVIQRSRFIATVGPAATAEEASEFVRRVSDAHAAATHNCWAFVVGPPGSTARVGMSDDGEPHGTAGRPMLTVLLHSGVGDVAAVVTRYYGGVKLGTGGLVRAYGGTLQLALDDLPRRERIELVSLDVAIPYSAVTAVKMLLPTFEASVLDETFAAEASMRVALPSSRADAFRAALMDATRGKCEIADSVAS
jgi:uncharacterized YigZ family protein